MTKKTLILFARAPEPGKVKTRLAKEVGEHKALEIYKWLLSKALSTLKHFSGTRILSYTGNATLFRNTNHEEFLIEKQSGNDLGLRMLDAFEKAHKRNNGPVVLFGSDCPDLDHNIIKEAFSILETNDLVIGPALDGGYYLIGLNKNLPDLFLGMEWSTAGVLANTIRKATQAGISFDLLKPLKDLDVLEDLPQGLRDSFKIKT